MDARKDRTAVCLERVRAAVRSSAERIERSDVLQQQSGQLIAKAMGVFQKHQKYSQNGISSACSRPRTNDRLLAFVG